LDRLITYIDINVCNGNILLVTDKPHIFTWPVYVIYFLALLLLFQHRPLVSYLRSCWTTFVIIVFMER